MTKTDQGEPKHTDLQIVYAMAKQAAKEGVLPEVINSFGQFRASGDDVQEAARCALYEWDC